SRMDHRIDSLDEKGHLVLISNVRCGPRLVETGLGVGRLLLLPLPLETFLQPLQRPAVLRELPHIAFERRLRVPCASELQERGPLQLTNRNWPVGRLHIRQPISE